MGLYLHTFFGTHKNAVPVEVRRKGHAVFGYLAKRRKGKDLKTAAVGKYRAFPAGKGVQPSHFVNDFVGRTEMQVVGVAEHDLTADVFKIESGNAALYRRRRRDVHKNGSLNRAVNSLKFSETGVLFFFYKCEHGFFLYVIVLNVSRIIGRGWGL